MSFPVGTILKRDEPLPDVDAAGPGDENDEETTIAVPNPLNELEVIGPSPISTSSVAEWNGVGGEALIVRPYREFGATQVAPIAALQSDYSVVSLGDPEAVRKEVTIEPAEKQRRLLSPETIFAQEAKAAKEPVKRGPGRPPKETA